MLTRVNEIAQKKTTTKETLISNINDMIDELESELEITNDLHTIDNFFLGVKGFVDCEASDGIESQIEDITGCKLKSVGWFDYYIDKRDELTQTKFTTRIVLTDGSGWTYDTIYATNEGHALNIMIANYNAFEDDRVNIEHYNGNEWEVVGEYIWRE